MKVGWVSVVVAAGVVGAVLAYRINPLYLHRYSETPNSIPEWMVVQGRLMGEM